MLAWRLSETAALLISIMMSNPDQKKRKTQLTELF